MTQDTRWSLKIVFYSLQLLLPHSILFERTYMKMVLPGKGRTNVLWSTHAMCEVSYCTTNNKVCFSKKCRTLYNLFCDVAARFVVDFMVWWLVVVWTSAIFFQITLRRLAKFLLPLPCEQHTETGCELIRREKVTKALNYSFKYSTIRQNYTKTCRLVKTMSGNEWTLAYRTRLQQTLLLQFIVYRRK